MKSTVTRCGSIAVTIHWLSAAFILVLIGTGFRTSSLTEPEAKAALLQLHVPLGLVILTLTLFRIGCWVFVDQKPRPMPGTPRNQRILATVTHVLVYVVMLGMAASGIGMMLLSGAGEVIFGGSSVSLPDFWKYLPRVPHAIGARLIVALLVLHTFAALWHHFVRLDGLMARMWYGYG